MPAPSSFAFTDALNVSAQTLIRNAIDAGTGAGKLKLYSEADALLGTITLDDPCGTISASGTLTVTAASDGAASADGEVTWGEFTDSDDTRVCIAPVSQGVSAVSGQIVLNSTDLVNGADIELVSATFG